jgi:serine/threonine protein kinase, bacterial
MVDAQRRGFLVLTGRCHGIRDENPLAPIWQALGVLERHDSWVGNTELVRRWQQILQLAKTSVEVRLFQALAELVLLQAALSPLALLLDDMQRAAPAMVQLVDHLVRLTQNAPVFLVVNYREAQLTEVNPALAQAVQDLTRERLAVRITLRPFIPEETATLAAVLMGQEQVSEEFAGFLHRRSKGNPRYIEELVQSLGGRLELEGLIGAGAMGHVFAAYDRKTDRAVAAKLILARGELSAETLHQFQKEGAMLASLSHPHVVRIYDTFIEEHASCIIMERVEGRSLRQVLDEGPLPLPRAKQLFQQVAAALDHAHQMQIVHCDIKPDNIMVTASDQVKVTDFGIARILKSDITLETLTTTGMRMGTPLYMAPEQIEGKKVDGRADIYGMGAVLFHMVTGRPPFEGNDPLAIIAKHLQEDAPPPSAVDPSIPADWDAVILKALAKDPARRHQSAAAFLGAIADLSTSEGPDPAAGARAATRRRRKRWFLLIGGASAAVLIAGAGALAMLGSASPQPVTVVGRNVPQWGYAGFISPSLRAPSGIAANTQGDVYVADTNHDRIVELPPSGLPIGQWGTPGHDVGQLGHPAGLLVDTHGDVYVADTNNYRIQEFSPNGKWLGQWPLSVTDNPYLNPEYLAGDGRGAIYVTTVPDPHVASNLIKLVPGGGSQVVGLPARLQNCSDSCVERPLGDPVGVAVDAAGAVYVPDAAGNAIRKLSPAGKLLSTWPTRFNHPSGIALDPEGQIYIADMGNSRIVKLSATGRLLASWRTAGPSSMPFRSPEALAVDARGNVFVADTGNNRILELSPEGIVSSQWNTQPPVPIVRLRVRP